MPKVILLVNVELAAGKREEYLRATSELRSRIDGTDGVSYSVYENQGKEKDSFTEMLTFPDVATYEAFDDREDDTNDLFANILAMATRAPKYTTLFEVE